MIEISNLRKEYSQDNHSVVALDGVSLHVRTGEVFGVIGQSGAGKSTLIRCINSLERPTSGSVKVDGQEITTLSGAKLRQARQRIGMIFQHFNLLNSRTAAQNIAFPLEVMGYSKLKRKARVEELLALVGLEGKGNAYPSQLSGGQKQRVGIARALAGEPKVLLSDEATSALDPQTTRSILQLLRELNRRMGLTILLITHDMGVVKQICDSVAILQAGRVVEEGRVLDLVTRPDSILSREFFPHVSTRPPHPGAVRTTITLVGEAAQKPVISTLARRFDVDVNIISGGVEAIGEQQVGQFQVELSGAGVEAALEYLQNSDVPVEVH